MKVPNTPIPAATLIVMREGDGCPPELLMVERAATMAFAAGALVFPGGRIDPEDLAMAERLSGGIGDQSMLAAKIAAIRETLEETGIAVGLTVSDADRLEAIGGAIREGAAFADALIDAGAQIDVPSLEYFARWCPRSYHGRVFDTYFFVAHLAGRSEPVVDPAENQRAFWATASQLIDEADAGRAHVILPTRRNLERLATFSGFADAVASARAFPPRSIEVRREVRGGVSYLCIPDDAGYPITAERADEAVTVAARPSSDI